MPRKLSVLCAFGVGQNFLEIPSLCRGRVQWKEEEPWEPVFLHPNGGKAAVGPLGRRRLWVISLVQWVTERNSWVSKTTEMKTKNIRFRFRPVT